VNELAWILGGGLLMSLIALSGGLSVLLPRAVLDRALLPLVGLAAGTLLGGAFFHMMPSALETLDWFAAATWLLAGFTAFLGLEQWLQGRQRSADESRPDRDAEGRRERPEAFNWLILIGDAIHNFIGGLAVAGTFLISPQAGIMAWIAAAAHEVPQELGDFGVLVHGGWSRRRALAWNFASALTFPAGALLAWALSRGIEVDWLIMFGAGSFLYIAGSNLIPEIKTATRRSRVLLHFSAFVVGLILMGALHRLFGHA
jgi:zinc and cadmium transporter